MNRTDIIVVALALISLPFLYLHYWSDSTEADSVVISTHDNKRIILPLDKDDMIEVEGPLGINVIEIKDKRARFVQSPCPNKVCIHSGWVEHNNDFAACLPNGVLLSIGNEHQEFDAINF